MKPRFYTLMFLYFIFLTLFSACNFFGGTETGNPTNSDGDPIVVPGDNDNADCDPETDEDCVCDENGDCSTTQSISDSSVLTTLARGSASLELEEEYAVIESESDLLTYWQALHEDQSPLPDVPEVDFSEHMVLLVVMGQRSNGGFAISVEGYQTGPEEITVNVTKSVSGSGCMTTMALTNPFHMIQIPASDLAVAFDVESSVLVCE